MPAPTLVVFDLDGTLVDTAPDLAATMNRLLRRLGRRELDPESVRMMVGRGARVLMEKALAATGAVPDDGALDALVDDYLALYEANIAEHSRPFPGLVEALEGLSARGIGAAVCTNKPERLSALLLDELGLSRHFLSLVGGDTLAVRKPEPAPLIEAVRRAGTGSGTGSDTGPGIAGAVMVGDSITDLTTARAAGVPFVGVSFGYTEQPMAELGPDILIDRFDELGAALARL